MNEVKNLFEEDVREKKIIARNASKRATHSKKHMFTFEKMSGKERKQYMAPSEITTFTLKPMTLSEFGRHSEEQKIELLKWYGEKYGWFAGALADALHCSWQGASNQIEKFGLKQFFAEQKRKTTFEQEAVQAKERAKLVGKPVVTEEKRWVESYTPTKEKPLTVVESGENKQVEREVLFEIKAQGERTSEDLRNQLEAIASCLGNGTYTIELSIKQFASMPKEQQSESNVVNA